MIFEDRTVKSHRGTGKRRRKGGGRLPVAPWVIIVAVCAVVIAAVTVVFVKAVRGACSGDVYRVPVSASGSVASGLKELASEWESTSPSYDGQCIGVSVERVSSVDAAGGLSGVWNERNLGKRPVAWVPDSSAWLDWVGESGTAGDLAAADRTLLGSSHLVLAVPEPVLAENPWLEEASWEEIASRAAGGDLDLASASPRTSSSGLHTLLNVALDEQGEGDRKAVENLAAALESGKTAATASEIFGQVTELRAAGEDPMAFADAYAAFDYEVESFNKGSGDFQLSVVEPAASLPDPVYPYVVLSDADWVGDVDARVAEEFGKFLATEAARTTLAESGLHTDAADEHGETLSSDTVRTALESWYSLRREVDVLALVDTSETMEGSLSAAVDDFSALVDGLGDSSRVGLWDFSGQASENSVFVDAEAGVLGEGGHRDTVENAAYSLRAVPGGPPVYGALATAVDYMNDNASEGTTSSIVVFTSAAGDPVSAVDLETATDLASTGSARVIVVGYPGADEASLTQIAESSGGVYVDASAEDADSRLADAVLGL
ncbi:vWA domain-containing protein [Salininema proteolyticum]|uniref:Substrate-binding domain-containing protein n=1 Tax=Salininema proteolyticum TaxID=1607685 RepID=A0ABV8TUK2_9ACTN